MNVFGRGGLFNVTQRTAAGYNNSNVHIIEGEIEVKRLSEQGVDIFKFQIESFSQKQIEYRTGKFVNNASIVFTGALADGVIKIKDVDYAGPSHFFSDTTKALMNNSLATAAPQQGQANNYYGNFAQVQQAPSAATQQQNQPNNYFGNFAQQASPVAVPVAAPVTQAPPVNNFYAQQAPPTQTAPVQQYAQQSAPQNQAAPPIFAAPSNIQPAPPVQQQQQQQQQQFQGGQQNTAPVDYAQLFSSNQ